MKSNLEQEEHSTYLEKVRKDDERTNPYLEELVHAEREIDFLNNVINYLAEELAKDNPLFNASEIKNRAYYYASIEK